MKIYQQEHLSNHIQKDIGLANRTSTKPMETQARLGKFIQRQIRQLIDKTKRQPGPIAKFRYA